MFIIARKNDLSIHFMTFYDFWGWTQRRAKTTLETAILSNFASEKQKITSVLVDKSDFLDKVYCFLFAVFTDETSITRRLVQAASSVLNSCSDM